jgi:hypothetical protein
MTVEAFSFPNDHNEKKRGMTGQVMPISLIEFEHREALANKKTEEILQRSMTSEPNSLISKKFPVFFPQRSMASLNIPFSSTSSTPSIMGLQTRTPQNGY